MARVAQRPEHAERASFTGWPEEALDFFDGLAADNSKTYWTANKAVYEQAVLAPMLALLGELEPEFGSGRVFRPYRDVRFSRDKSPYKTEIAATLAGGGYVQLSVNGLFAGTGMYHLEPDQLRRYREAVADEATGAPLAALVAQLGRKGIEIHAHDVLKTVPRGFPADHPRADLLRHKGLVTGQLWPPGPWLATRQPKTRVATFLRASAPVNDWLRTHVG